MDHLEAARAEAFRFHPADLLRGFRLTGTLDRSGVSRTCFTNPAGRSIHGDEVDAVYYRNHDRIRPPREIADLGVAEYVARETEANFREILESLGCFWLTHPLTIRRSQSKRLQLQVAHRVGLAIPGSCWSNNAEAVTHFASEAPSGILAKPVSDVEYYVANRPYTVWVSQVPKRLLRTDAQELSLMVGSYQERVDREADIRVTVVDDELFACEIRVPLEHRNTPDWRAVPGNLAYRRFDLPADVSEKLLKLNAQLGVRFGAIDLLLTTSGEFVFLESNINGQWLWIEQLVGLPIAQALASLLLRGAREHRAGRA